MIRLQQLRIDAFLSVEELSAQTKVPPKTIYNIERGSVTRPRMETLRPLCRYFDVSGTELLGKVDEPERDAA